jgi:NADH dehydrogenase [ubiquinone] 1 alpha subcomplex assembly factor 1
MFSIILHQLTASLKFLGQPMKWHRLDDGVMGGQSETILSEAHEQGSAPSDELHFTGQINTQGGGFCSIRSPIEGGLPSNTSAIRVRYVGDGKTYKVLFSDGNQSAFGPSRRSPSWQHDLPTKEGVEETTTIRLDLLIPSLQGGAVETEMKLDPTKVQQIGFMLSLKLSSGASNPMETFGCGIFPFSLKVRSIEVVSADEIAK